MLIIMFFTSLILSYLTGSISTAVIVCRFLNLPDPRTEGSKNAGATNVMRIGGKKAALYVFLGDAMKGVLAIFLGVYLGLSGNWLALTGVMAIIGHIKPIFFQGEGGKGVATYFGVLLALSPLLGILALVAWVVILKITKISSISALISVLIVPLLSHILHPQYAIILWLMAILIFWTHQDNLKRLQAGDESKIA